MLDAARRIGRYVEGLSRDQFVTRDMAFDAVCLNLIRIGEAARFLGDDAKAALPTVRWPDVVTMRNRIAHGYKSLEEEIIWRTATESVRDLANAIRAFLGRGV